MKNITNNTTANVKAVTPVALDVHALFPECANDVCSKPVKIMGFKHNAINAMSVLVPPLDDNFIFSADVLRDVVVFHRFGQPGQGIYLSGPTGCGKSASIRQYCARTGIGLTFAVASRTSEVHDFIGSMGIVKGNTEFKKGPLLLAMQLGMWFLLDEIDLLDPGIATAINLILDGSGYLIPETGEFVKCSPHFRFIATGNTFGEGQSDEYLGTQQQNKAFLDRFLKVQVFYPEEEVELEILKKVAPHSEAAHSALVKFANQIREMHTKGEYGSVPISTRALIRWAQYAEYFKEFNLGGQDHIKYAFERVILFSADSTGRNILSQHFFNLFKA